MSRHAVAARKRTCAYEQGRMDRMRDRLVAVAPDAVGKTVLDPVLTARVGGA